MRQAEGCSPHSRESPAAANSKIPAAGCGEAGASLPLSLPRGPILRSWEDLEGVSQLGCKCNCSLSSRLCKTPKRLPNGEILSGLLECLC